MGRALTKIGVLICFLFFRLIDSQSLTILCGGKDRRYRFAQEAIREGWIKEIKLEERERTTHRMTLYAITKQGIRHLRDNLPGSFLDFLSDSMLRSMAIFDKDEYSNMARKRIADTSAAMIMAVVMGGNIPEEVFILKPNRNQTIFSAGFAPYCVAFLDHIYPLCSAEGALSGTNPSRKSLSSSY